MPWLRLLFSDLAYGSLYVIPSATAAFFISYVIIDKFKFDYEPIKQFSIQAMQRVAYYYLALIIFAGSSFFVPTLRAITCSRHKEWECTDNAIKTEPLLFGVIIASVYLFASLFDHRRKKYLEELLK